MNRAGNDLPSVSAVRIEGDLGGMAPAEAGSLLSGLLTDIAKECVSAGSVMIGHIKGNFFSGNEMLSVSCTNDEGIVGYKSRFASPVSGYEAVLNAIVYGLDAHMLEDITVRQAESLPGTVSIEVLEGLCRNIECEDSGHINLLLP